jgi:hypothetical protein
LGCFIAVDADRSMNKLPPDLSCERFGVVFASKLEDYGFGVLGKVDLEALLLHAMLQASKSLNEADSYGRAEMLRITDQKYRTLIKRAAIWLDDSSKGLDDHALFEEFLTEVLNAYVNAPEQTEIRLLVDDEIRRRNIQRALERASAQSNGIPIEISLTGRSLILRATYLDSMLERVKYSQSLPAALRKLIKDKQGRELRIKVLDFAKATGKAFAPKLAGLMVGAVFGG